MTELQRYKLWFGDGEASMEPDQSGKWMKAEDAARFVEVCNQLGAILSHASGDWPLVEGEPMLVRRLKLLISDFKGVATKQEAPKYAEFAGMSGVQILRTIQAAQSATKQAEAPTASNEREAFEQHMMKYGWRDFTGEVTGSPPCWRYDNAELNYRWIGWREALERAALATQQEAQPQAKLGDPSPDDLWAFYAANVGLEVKHSWGTAVALLDAAIKKYSHILPIEAVNIAVQTKPLTPAQRRELIDRAGDITDGLNQDDFADEIIKLVEEHHGIRATKQAEAPTASNERSPKDFAIEHAEYMAKNAEHLIDAVNDLAKAEQENEDGLANQSDVDAARETLSERQTALRGGIYEFRKRRDRATLAAQQEAQPQAEMRGALERIAKWFGEFPPTGRFHENGEPQSYGYCFGSNGERDYMREVARSALDRAAQQATGERG